MIYNQGYETNYYRSQILQYCNLVIKWTFIRNLVSEKGKGNFLTFIYHNLSRWFSPLIQTWVFTFFVISSENPQKEVPSIKIVVTYVVIFSIGRKRLDYTIAVLCKLCTLHIVYFCNRNPINMNKGTTEFLF